MNFNSKPDGYNMICNNRMDLCFAGEDRGEEEIRLLVFYGSFFHPRADLLVMWRMERVK